MHAHSVRNYFHTRKKEIRNHSIGINQNFMIFWKTFYSASTGKESYFHLKIKVSAGWVYWPAESINEDTRVWKGQTTKLINSKVIRFRSIQHSPTQPIWLKRFSCCCFSCNNCWSPEMIAFNRNHRGRTVTILSLRKKKDVEGRKKLIFVAFGQSNRQLDLIEMVTENTRDNHQHLCRSEVCVWIGPSKVQKTWTKVCKWLVVATPRFVGQQFVAGKMFCSCGFL